MYKTSPVCVYLSALKKKYAEHSEAVITHFTEVLKLQQQKESEKMKNNHEN